MLSSKYRFHGHNSLRYVYANGKAVRSQAVTIKWVENNHRTFSRVSVVVSKKVIKSAVGRNRIRRRVYEFTRHQLPSLSGVFDIVIIVTSSELRTIPSDQLEAQLTQLFEKAELYKTV